MLLMLEDDTERIERFEAVLHRVALDMQVRLWRNAHQMIDEVGPLLSQATFLSLDHDLEPVPGGATQETA